MSDTYTLSDTYPEKIISCRQLEGENCRKYEVMDTHQHHIVDITIETHKIMLSNNERKNAACFEENAAKVRAIKVDLKNTTTAAHALAPHYTAHAAAGVDLDLIARVIAGISGNALLLHKKDANAIIANEMEKREATASAAKYLLEFKGQKSFANPNESYCTLISAGKTLPVMIARIEYAHSKVIQVETLIDSDENPPEEKTMIILRNNKATSILKEKMGAAGIMVSPAKGWDDVVTVYAPTAVVIEKLRDGGLIPPFIANEIIEKSRQKTA